MDLAGKRIVITGAFGSLGKHVIQMALEAGARVAAIDYAPAQGESREDNWVPLGGVDLTSEQTAQQAFAQAAEALGGWVA